MSGTSHSVMAGLVPAIHVSLQERKTWMPGLKPGMTKSLDIVFGELDR